MADASGKQCKDCRYPLDQLRSRTCPECGRAFDPDDAATFYAPSDWPPDAVAVVAGVVAFPVLAGCLIRLQVAVLCLWHDGQVLIADNGIWRQVWGNRRHATDITLSPLVSNVFYFQLVQLLLVALLAAIVIGRKIHDVRRDR